MRRAAAVVFLLGCGLDETGEAALDASNGDVVIDVVADVKEEPFVCADAGVASCTDAVQFRSPALYSPDRNTPCPAGYDTQDLVLGTPSVPNCTCSCPSTAPTCDTTLVSYHYGSNGNCGTGSGSYTLNGCTQTAQSTFIGESVQIDPPKLLGGCGGAGTSVPVSASSTNVRVCMPQCASDESQCTAQSGLRACVAVAGNVASCPTNYASGPFYLGSVPTVTCEPCSCTQNGDCNGSTDHLFGDTACGAGDQSFAMDGVCHALSGGQISTFRSAQITPSVQNAACQATPGLAHVAYGGNDVTLCCQ
jgi:hypothetical protein